MIQRTHHEREHEGRCFSFEGETPFAAIQSNYKSNAVLFQNLHGQSTVWLCHNKMKIGVALITIWMYTLIPFFILSIYISCSFSPSSPTNTFTSNVSPFILSQKTVVQGQTRYYVRKYCVRSETLIFRQFGNYKWWVSN